MTGTDHAALGAELSALLKLAAPPIGIAFRDSAETPGVAPIGGSRPAPTEDGRTGAAAAPCVFWFLATDRVFSTVAADHANCSVGSYTHGFRTLPRSPTRPTSRRWSSRAGSARPTSRRSRR